MRFSVHTRFNFDHTRLKWALWFVGLTVLRKNKLKCPLHLINIPRQRNVRRLECIIYRRFVDFQVLDKDIITGDFQFVRDFTPGIFVARVSQAASITRAGIWREVLEFVRLPLPLLRVGRECF